jgi:hypothetical protein
MFCNEYYNYKSLTIYGNREISSNEGWSEVVNDIQTVLLEEGITSISENIFKDHTTLTTISIPKSVITIGNNILRGCTALKTITVAEGNAGYSSDTNGILYNKDKTTLIQYPLGREGTSYTIPEDLTTLTTIKKYAFENAQNIETISILKYVTTIEESAFESISGLRTVTIGTTVQTIGQYAFRYCNNLESFTVTDGNAGGYKSVDSILFKGTELVQYPAKKTTEKYYIPIDTTIIHSYAFHKNEYIQFIITSDKITTIGSNAFEGCSALYEFYYLSTIN